MAGVTSVKTPGVYRCRCTAAASYKNSIKEITKSKVNAQINLARPPDLAVIDAITGQGEGPGRQILWR
jgi:hypothetical protein